MRGHSCSVYNLRPAFRTVTPTADWSRIELCEYLVRADWVVILSKNHRDLEDANQKEFFAAGSVAYLMTLVDARQTLRAVTRIWHYGPISYYDVLVMVTAAWVPGTERVEVPIGKPAHYYKSWKQRGSKPMSENGQ